MNILKKWGRKEYNKKQRLMAIILGGIIFWVLIPIFILVGAFYIDRWLHLPRFTYGLINPIIGSIFMAVGWLFANWTVKVQYTLGRGTPIPLMATQKLIIEGPYQYCRNPMALGTAIFYIGIAIWIGSFSAL